MLKLHEVPQPSGLDEEMRRKAQLEELRRIESENSAIVSMNSDTAVPGAGNIFQSTLFTNVRSRLIPFTGSRKSPGGNAEVQYLTTSDIRDELSIEMPSTVQGLPPLLKGEWQPRRVPSSEVLCVMGAQASRKTWKRERIREKPRITALAPCPRTHSRVHLNKVHDKSSRAAPAQRKSNPDISIHHSPGYPIIPSKPPPRKSQTEAFTFTSLIEAEENPRMMRQHPLQSVDTSWVETRHHGSIGGGWRGNSPATRGQKPNALIESTSFVGRAPIPAPAVHMLGFSPMPVVEGESRESGVQHIEAYTAMNVNVVSNMQKKEKDKEQMNYQREECLKAGRKPLGDGDQSEDGNLVSKSVDISRDLLAFVGRPPPRAPMMQMLDISPPFDEEERFRKTREQKLQEVEGMTAVKVEGMGRQETITITWMEDQATVKAEEREEALEDMVDWEGDTENDTVASEIEASEQEKADKDGSQPAPSVTSSNEATSVIEYVPAASTQTPLRLMSPEPTSDPMACSLLLAIHTTTLSYASRDYRIALVRGETDDRELFRLFRTAYNQELRTFWQRFFSLKGLIYINIFEYTDTTRPVLVHMDAPSRKSLLYAYNNPQKIVTDHTWVDWVFELKARRPQRFGIEFVQGWDKRKIVALAAVPWVASVLTGILWSVFGNVQSAMAVAGYILTASGGISSTSPKTSND